MAHGWNDTELTLKEEPVDLPAPDENLTFHAERPPEEKDLCDSSETVSSHSDSFTTTKQQQNCHESEGKKSVSLVQQLDTDRSLAGKSCTDSDSIAGELSCLAPPNQGCRALVNAQDETDVLDQYSDVSSCSEPEVGALNELDSETNCCQPGITQMKWNFNLLKMSSACNVAGSLEWSSPSRNACSGSDLNDVNVVNGSDFTSCNQEDLKNNEKKDGSILDQDGNGSNISSPLQTTCDTSPLSETKTQSLECTSQSSPDCRVNEFKSLSVSFKDSVCLDGSDVSNMIPKEDGKPKRETKTCDQVLDSCFDFSNVLGSKKDLRVQDQFEADSVKNGQKLEEGDLGAVKGGVKRQSSFEFLERYLGLAAGARGKNSPAKECQNGIAKSISEITTGEKSVHRVQELPGGAPVPLVQMDLAQRTVEQKTEKMLLPHVNAQEALLSADCHTDSPVPVKSNDTVAFSSQTKEDCIRAPTSDDPSPLVFGKAKFVGTAALDFSDDGFSEKLIAQQTRQMGGSDLAPLVSSHHLKRLLHPVILLNCSRQNVSKKDEYHCAECLETAPNLAQLIEHHRVTHSLCNFHFCQICRSYFTDATLAKRHLCRQRGGSSKKQKTFRKLYQCQYCSLTLNRLYEFHKHERLHTGITPFKCDKCGLYFAQSASLGRHKRLGRCRVSLPQDSSQKPKGQTSNPTPKSQESSFNGLSAQLPRCFVKLVDFRKEKPNAAPSGRLETYDNSFRLDALVRQCTSDADRRFKCPNCQKAFRHSSNLCRHKKRCKIGSGNHKTAFIRHLKKLVGQYKCPLCPRVFKYSYNRFRHMRVQCLKDFSQEGKGKQGTVYKCALCTRTFSNSSNRNRHIRMVCMKDYIHRESFRIRREFQEQKESTQQQLAAQPQPTNRLRHRCSLCPAIFAHSSGKYKHMVKHRLFEKTGKPFRYRNSFPVPVKPETENSCLGLGVKGCDDTSRTHLSCHYCGKNFSTSSAITNHMRLHKGERPYRCLECGKRFLRRAHLDAHKKVHQRRIQCTVCKKIVPTIGELIKHRKSHINKGMLQCPDCPLQFKYPAFLLRHLSKLHSSVQQNPPKEQQCSPQEKEQQQEDDSEEFKCSLCQEFFDSAATLNKHCLSHMPAHSAKQCPFCKRHFSNRPGLVRHIRLHTGEKPYRCDGCGKCFSRNEALKTHKEKCKTENREHSVPTAEIEKKYSCKYCPQTFVWPCSLSKHQKNHILKLLFPCSKCGKCYKKLRLLSHERVCNSSAATQADATATTLLTCAKCGQTFYRKSNQVVHERKCTGAKSVLAGNFLRKDKCIGSKNMEKLKHRCLHCPKAFRYRCYLLRHLVVHAKDKQYSCMHCGHRYASYSRYLHHEAFCNGVYRCKQSINVTGHVKEQPALEIMTKGETTHVTKVEGEGQYKCRFCNKTFMRARNLRRHILTHTGVKPYRCKSCESRFSRHDHLKVHQKHCKGKKRKLEVRILKISLEDLVEGWKKVEEPKAIQAFDCNTCNKRFGTRTNLARHIAMLHTTVKPFSCSRCGTSFSHLSSLKKHDLKCKEKVFSFFSTVVSQSNGSNSTNDSNVTQSSRDASEILMKFQRQYPDSRKFFCTYCPRRFKNQDQLKVHTRLHTGEKPFGCASCGERFIRRDYLQRHLIKCGFGAERMESLLCHMCGELFPSQDQLRNHLNSCAVSSKSPDSHPEEPECSSTSLKIKGFSCTICSQHFLLFSQLQQHFLTMHREDASHQLLNSSSPLKQQMYSMVSVKEEPADEGYREDGLSKCELLASNLPLRAPGDIKKPFSCPHCNMQLRNASGLGMHLRVHSGQYTFSCLKCQRGFWSKNSLKKHQRTCRNLQMPTKEEPHSESTVPLRVNCKATNTVLVFNSGSKATGTGVLQTGFSCKEGNKDGQPDAIDVQQKQDGIVHKYQCSECCQSFTDGLLLISHLEEHNRQKQEQNQGHVCRVCGRVFNQPAVLLRHLRMHRKTKPYACSECPKSFRYPSDLDVHRNCHDPNRPFICSACGLRFWTNKSLKRHSSAVHHRPFKPRGIYTCRKCDKFFPDKPSYQKHWKRMHYRTGIHFEGQSNRKLFSGERLSFEMNIGEGHMHGDDCDDSNDSDSAPYFPCHVCGKTFTTSESLEDHQRCHLGEKPHECEECGKCFFQLAHLQQHQRSHKSEFQCQTCGRGFVSLFALRKHKHSHGKSRPYRCPRCQLSFTGPAQLAEHMATHGDDNFPCDLCDRTFSCRLSRVQHRMSHTEPEESLPPLLPPAGIATSLSSVSVPSDADQPKHRCGVCNKRFRDTEQLSEHGCHAGRERPYSCAECNQYFLQGSHLKKHQLSHQLSKAYSYQCQLCHMCFGFHRQFLDHLKGHGIKGSEDASSKKGAMRSSETNSRNIYRCPICLRSFSHPVELANHLFIHAENIFACETCGETFGNESNLREHEQCHLTASTQYECTECGDSFLGSNAFRQHLCTPQKRSTAKTDRLEPPPELPLAKGLTAQPVALSQQIEEDEVEVDVGEDFYNCPDCGKRFPSKASLEEHQRQHAPERRFKCLVCNKFFAKKRYLKKHEVIHQRTNRRSGSSQTIGGAKACVVHQQEHGDAERRQSSVCLKNAVVPQGLLHHRKTQSERTDEIGGDFRCDMCYRSFNQLSLLRQHQETHVGQVVYECTECDKAFAFFHLLEEHQSTHSVVTPSSASSLD